MTCYSEEHRDLIERVCALYEEIASLESLKPSENVNRIFTELVNLCIPAYPDLDVTQFPENVQIIRSDLIRLCGEAEGLLEAHHSTILGEYENPLHHLHRFPYYENYITLSELEFSLLSRHFQYVPSQVAFIGSGPLPLSSIVLAINHLTRTTFHNYDIDPMANIMASRLVESDPDMSSRMIFHTTDIMAVEDDLERFEVVFLAALVGMNIEDKLNVIRHLENHMAPGAILILRSAHGARAFLYPVVQPGDLQGFQVLEVFHPTGEVINSVIIARKSRSISNGLAKIMCCCCCL